VFDPMFEIKHQVSKKETNYIPCPKISDVVDWLRLENRKHGFRGIVSIVLTDK